MTITSWKDLVRTAPCPSMESIVIGAGPDQDHDCGPQSTHDWGITPGSDGPRRSTMSDRPLVDSRGDILPTGPDAPNRYGSNVWHRLAPTPSESPRPGPMHRPDDRPGHLTHTPSRPRWHGRQLLRAGRRRPIKHRTGVHVANKKEPCAWTVYPINI